VERGERRRGRRRRRKRRSGRRVRGDIPRDKLECRPKHTTS
jgi:hypothetical protein